MGRYLNHSDQGERLQEILEMAPIGPRGAILGTPRRVFRRLEPNKVAELIRGYVDGRRVDELASEFQINKSTSASWSWQLRRQISQSSQVGRPFTRMGALSSGHRAVAKR